MVQAHPRTPPGMRARLLFFWRYGRKSLSRGGRCEIRGFSCSTLGTNVWRRAAHSYGLWANRGSVGKPTIWARTINALSPRGTSGRGRNSRLRKNLRLSTPGIRYKTSHGRSDTLGPAANADDAGTTRRRIDLANL